MDIRNVQKSGNTYYIYLPASWCKQNNISTKSKVALETSSEGNLLISPNAAERKESNLFLNIKEHDMKIINKFIVASYLNPVKSFRIQVDRKITSLDILDQKRLLGGIEVVEFGDNQIMCESSITVEDPGVLLKTMIKKMANMLNIMMKGSSAELLERYEEEIDRSNMLITKSVITALMFRTSSKLRNIDLFYISLLSKNLEGVADNFLKLKKQKNLQQNCLDLMNLLVKTIEEMNVQSTVKFAKEVRKIELLIDRQSNSERIIPLKTYLGQLVDTLVDWTITQEIET
ncbi:hypothetical protein JXB11_03450 [Candidatus Woesearchaeota archaeon]|nr:hypothetical protein [Candidatus Woesearchaeota archaeon]